MLVTQTDQRTATVDAGSALALTLDAAKGKPLVLVKDGMRFRVAPEDLWAYYDPERVREALRASAGALAGIDVEAFKAEMRELRGPISFGRSDDFDPTDH